MSVEDQLERAREVHYAAIDAALKARTPCCDTCPGWIVSVVDHWPGVELQVCDECDPPGLMDYDVAFLPEAREALHAHPAVKDEEGGAP